MKKHIYILFSLLLSGYSYATIINIPADQPTIQAGINVAINGDTILVQPGSYVENVNYNGKNIAVASLFLLTQDTGYISQTVINGGGGAQSPVVVFENGEDSTAMLTGFTITNGCNYRGGGIYCSGASPVLLYLTISQNYTHYWNGYSRGGGGVYCENSGLTLGNVTIINNSAMGSSCPSVGLDVGGGIYCNNSNILMQNVMIKNNTAESGGGIYLDNSSPVLQNVNISSNTAIPDYNPMWWVFYDSFGGGLSCVNGSNPVLLDVMISGNSAASGWSQYSSAYGGGIYCSGSCPNLQNVIIANNSVTSGMDDLGGGIYCTGSTPNLKYVNIKDNSARSGGGIYCDNSNPHLENVTVAANSAVYEGGGMYCALSNPVFDSINRCNIYLNTAFNGNDLYSDTTIHIVVDTFTVLYPTEYHADPLDNYSFDILNGKLEQVDADLYVSPEGDNGYTGLTVNDPLKNLSYAFSIIRADSFHQNTIHLLEGIYSQSTTEEVFPINVPGYISVIGDPENSVIMDAEEQSSVLMIDFNKETFIKNLTITGGNGNGIYCNNASPNIENVIVSENVGNGILCSESSCPLINNVQIFANTARGIVCESNSNAIIENSTIENNSAGGIQCSACNPILQNVQISGNSAENGGGISCDSASPNLLNVSIINNSASFGGAVYCAFNSSPNLENVIISGNTAPTGGGIYCSNNSNPILALGFISNNLATEGGGLYCSLSSPVFDSINRCNIYQNTAYWGNDIFTDTLLEVIVDTFTVIYPTEFHTYPIENYSFDILHGKIEQQDTDLYVSPEGDNSNSGLTPNDPLKTIHFAFSKIRSDSINQNTIHLLEGTYSPSSNGEYFPINMFDYVVICGVSESNVTLDAEGLTRVIEFYDAQGTKISGLTVTGSQYYYDGCGIYFYNSSSILENVTIVDNDGIGIYCDNSSPYIKESQISGNTGCGVICESNSNPLLENVQITNNSDRGLFCSHSSPVLLYVTISGHSIYGKNGGGIYCEDYSNPYLENVFITDNSVTESYWGEGGQAGGFYCNNFSNPVLKNVLFSGNTAENTGAGMACYYNCNPILINVTMSNNTSENTAGAFYNYISSHPIIVNSVFWNNLPNEIFSTNITISWSDIQGGWEGEGNIDGDPLFVGSGNYPYSLSDASPCVNAGIPDTSGLFLLELDLAGNSRFYGGRIDMGAYENQNISTLIQNPQSSNLNLICSPNPFREELTITWNQTESAHTTIEIYNSAGKRIETRVSEIFSEGDHQLNWNTNSIPPGIYFIHLNINYEIITKKIVKY